MIYFKNTLYYKQDFKYGLMKKNPDNINYSFVKIEKTQKLNSRNRNNTLKKIRSLKEKQKDNWDSKTHNKILSLQKQIKI